MALGRRAPEPLGRLLRFDATDGAPLAGLLFEPRRRTSRVVIFLHGTGGSSVFESKRTNALAAAFAREGIAYFPFNNRGAHLVRRLGRDLGGMAFEKIRDCVFDIDGAVRELWRRGYRDITLVGHSTGANKIAVYDSLQAAQSREALRAPRRRRRHGHALRPARRAPLPRRAAQSASDDPRAPRRRARAARAVVASDELALVLRHGQPERRLQRLPVPRSDARRAPVAPPALPPPPRHPQTGAGRSTARTTSTCYGDVSRCVAILADALGPKPNFELVVMEGADHGFSGREGELAELMVRWMEALARCN